MLRPPKPRPDKFNGVSANGRSWFLSAVDYVTGKGMMNGTADGTFSTKAGTPRHGRYRAVPLRTMPKHLGGFLPRMWLARTTQMRYLGDANIVFAATAGRSSAQATEVTAACGYPVPLRAVQEVQPFGAKARYSYGRAGVSGLCCSGAPKCCMWANAAGVVTGKSGISWTEGRACPRWWRQCSCASLRGISSKRAFLTARPSNAVSTAARPFLR